MLHSALFVIECVECYTVYCLLLCAFNVTQCIAWYRVRTMLRSVLLVLECDECYTVHCILYSVLNVTKYIV